MALIACCCSTVTRKRSDFRPQVSGQPYASKPAASPSASPAAPAVAPPKPAAPSPAAPAPTPIPVPAPVTHAVAEPAPEPAKEAAPAAGEAAVPSKPPPAAGENAMNVVFVASECAPWSKTGGLGDVVGALPKAMAARGHRVMVVSPRYSNYEEGWDTSVRRRFRVFGGDHEVRPLCAFSVMFLQSFEVLLLLLANHAIGWAVAEGGARTKIVRTDPAPPSQQHMPPLARPPPLTSVVNYLSLIVSRR